MSRARPRLHYKWGFVAVFQSQLMKAPRSIIYVVLINSCNSCKKHNELPHVNTAGIVL